MDLTYAGIKPNDFIAFLNVNRNNIVYDKLKSGDYETFSLVKLQK